MTETEVKEILFQTIKRIETWQNDKGLLSKFEPNNEARIIIEEALEMIGVKNAKEIASDIVAKYSVYPENYNDSEAKLTEITEMADAIGDLFVIIVGSVCKMFLRCGFPKEELIFRSCNLLNTIMTHNELKALNIDDTGKLIKSENFDESNKDTYPQFLIYELIKHYIENNNYGKNIVIDNYENKK